MKGSQEVIGLFLCFTVQLFQVTNGKDQLSSYFGSYIGKLSNRDENIFGQLFAVDKATVLISNLTYGGDTPLFLYAGTLGNDGGYTKTGYALRSVDGESQTLSKSDGVDITFKFPTGKNLFEVDWLGIISRKNKALYSRVLVDESTKESIPRPQTLEPLSGPNGLSSSEVVITDARTIVIKNFNFGGLAPDAHFMVGTAGLIPNEIDGFFIPDERGEESALGSYKNQTIVLEIPSHLQDFRSLKWFSIWSRGFSRSLAHVIIPPKLNVPPSIEGSHLDQQSTLNCEVLSDPIGLELRWTVVSEDESIIIQLVSRTDSDRYIAFGVKKPTAVESGSNLVAGDVVVGWVNSKSGKGEVDDYFLAGDNMKCDDGAESCPDTTKPGGGKQLELLNGLSRNNYTMLTFKRQLKASDSFDLDISIDETVNVFWSVGFKSAGLRKHNKPMKNQGPIIIDFGRRPSWNCAKDSEVSDEGMEGEAEKFDDQFDERLEAQEDNPKRHIQTTPSQENLPNRPLSRPVNRTPTPTPTPFPKPTPDLSSWLSPPTLPEVNSGGFLPNIGNINYDGTDFRPNMPFNDDARRSSSNLGTFPSQTESLEESSWNVPPITCQDTRLKDPLYIQLGPAAGHRGNQGVQSSSGGTAFYVNGLLAPDIYLERGKTYTFLTETGQGVDDSQTFQPVYFTSDPSGGHQLKTDLEKKIEKIFAGTAINSNDVVVPTLVGRLCRWQSQRPSITFASYEDFHKTLKMQCLPVDENNRSPVPRKRRVGKERNFGPSGVLQFTPTREMPDTIYYQSFMEKHLGGVIHLVDRCEPRELEPDFKAPPTTFRPHLSQYLSQESNIMKPESKSTQKIRGRSNVSAISNRRIEEDFDEIDSNDFEGEFSLEEKSRLLRICKMQDRSKVSVGRRGIMRRRSRRESSPVVNTMPVFEHFPMREVGMKPATPPPFKSSKVTDRSRSKEMKPEAKVIDDLYDENKCQKFKEFMLRKEEAADLENSFNKQDVLSYASDDTNVNVNEPVESEDRIQKTQENILNYQQKMESHQKIPEPKKPPHIPVPSDDEDYESEDSPSYSQGPDSSFYSHNKKGLDGKTDADKQVHAKEAKSKPRYPPTSAPPKLPPPGGDVPPYMLKGRFQGEKLQHVLLQAEDIADRADYEDYEDYDEYDGNVKSLPPLRLHQGHVRPATKRPFKPPPLPPNPDLKSGGDFNPFSKLMSPLKDILPSKWFHDDRVVDEERPKRVYQPPAGQLARPNGHAHPGNLQTYMNGHVDNQPRNSHQKLLSQGNPNLKKKFPPEQPQHGDINFRPGNFRNRGRPNSPLKSNLPKRFMMQQPSFVNENILRPEYLPSIIPGKSSKSEDLSVNESSQDEFYEDEEEVVDSPAEDPGAERRADVVRESHFARKILDKEPSNSVNVIPLSTEKYFSDEYSTEVDPNSFLQVVGAEIKAGSDQLALGDEPSIKVTGNPDLEDFDLQPSTLGIGFYPSGIQPESGFKPILDQGGGLPVLAFSVLDGIGDEDVVEDVNSQYPTTPEHDLPGRRVTTENILTENTQDTEESPIGFGGDRGDVAINVPAPVVPYVPTFRSVEKRPKPKKPTTSYSNHNTLFKSEDFHAFSTVASNDHQADEITPESYQGFEETDRIDVPNQLLPGAEVKPNLASNRYEVAVASVSEPEYPYKVDPQAVLFNKVSAPYGQQFPSFVPESMQTMIGTPGGGLKNFATANDVVYGKVHSQDRNGDDEMLEPEDAYDEEDEVFDQHEDYNSEMDFKEAPVSTTDQSIKATSMPSLVELWNQFQKKQKEK